MNLLTEGYSPSERTPAWLPRPPISPSPAPCQPLTFNVINITWHLSIFFASSGGQKALSEPPPHPLPTPLLSARQQMGSRVPAEQPGRRRFLPPSPPQRSPVDNSCTASINNFANNLIWEKDARATARRCGGCLENAAQFGTGGITWHVPDAGGEIGRPSLLSGCGLAAEMGIVSAGMMGWSPNSAG